MKQKEFIFSPSPLQILASKEDLKTGSQIIKHLKKELKASQREHSRKYRELDFEHDIQDFDWKNRDILPYYKDLIKKISTYDEHKLIMRAKHIAHAMMKGRSIQQIEPKCDPENYWKKHIAYNKAKKILYQHGVNWIE